MRRIGVIDYINLKSGKRKLGTANRIKEFIQKSSGQKLSTDEDYNSASLQLIEEEHDEIHQKLLNYFKWLSNDGLLPGSIHMIFSAIKGWLSANRYLIDPIEMQELKRLIPRNVIITEDAYLNIEKIRSIIAHSDSMLRAFILIACSSGARIGEILTLEIDSIKYWDEEDVYYFKIKSSDSKAGKPHRYYISHEAYKETLEYLKQRDQYADLRSIRTTRSLKKEVINSNNLFMITDNSLRNKLTKALKNADILSVDEESNRRTIHPHSFRKFADTVFKEHLGVNMGNELIGHDEGLSTSYRRYDPKAVAEAYRKVEPFVTILAPADYVEIKERVSADVEKIRAALSAQSLEMVEIKERLQETEELLSLTLGNNKK